MIVTGIPICVHERLYEINGKYCIIPYWMDLPDCEKQYLLEDKVREFSFRDNPEKIPMYKIEYDLSLISEKMVAENKVARSIEPIEKKSLEPAYKIAVISTDASTSVLRNIDHADIDYYHIAKWNDLFNVLNCKLNKYDLILFNLTCSTTDLIKMNNCFNINLIKTLSETVQIVNISTNFIYDAIDHVSHVTFDNIDSFVVNLNIVKEAIVTELRKKKEIYVAQNNEMIRSILKELKEQHSVIMTNIEGIEAKLIERNKDPKYVLMMRAKDAYIKLSKAEKKVEVEKYQ